MMPQHNTSENVYNGVYAQYVETASFLWVLRCLAVYRPHYTLQDIRALEQRLGLQLDGLMTSIDQGWAACEAGLETGEAGEVFTAAVIAIRSHDTFSIRQAVDAGLTSPDTQRGLISALGWLPASLAMPWIEKFLNGKDMRHKYLGVAASSVRRYDPGEILTTIVKREDCQQHAPLFARALRLIGELRRQDLMPVVMMAIASNQPIIKFWASWAAVVLGHSKAIEHLRPYVMQPGPLQLRAIQLVFRVLPVEQARTWVSDMAKDKALERGVITATGVLGDPHAVNWLIAKMRDPKVARLAGEAFSVITGVDLERQQVLGRAPAGVEFGPTEDPDDPNVSLDPDEDLPWPEVEKVAALWRSHGPHFIVGRRYFLGQPLSVEHLRATLAAGYQRQRHAAALELALVDSHQRLVNTQATTFT
ncbi:MAG: TIGR02270 family protein [Gammaproteobacteria bacterium]|nr:TIGR02270 family protein [Gammaproteobacteria bacterium]